MTNVSQLKRDKMLEYLRELRNTQKDERSQIFLSEIENFITSKRYGLEWEEHTEQVNEMLVNNIPVLVDVPDKTITVDKEQKYNFLLEGDNLHSLLLLQKTHKGKIDVIYIDPPYNTGNKDFIYSDNYVQKEDGFSHSKWLSFMHKRLEIARNLLSDIGVIFISIDDNEQAQLKLLCDEIFGENNFIATLSVENNPKGRKNSSFISKTSEYCHIYAKFKESAEFVENIPKDSKDMALDDSGNYIHNSGKRVLVGENNFNKLVVNPSSSKNYTVYHNPETNDLIFKQDETSVNSKNEDLIKKGYIRYCSYNEQGLVENTYSLERLNNLFEEGRLDFKNEKIYEKNFSDVIRMKSILVNRKYKAIINNQEVVYEIDLKTTSAKQMLSSILGKDKFSYPKNISYIKLLLTLFENKDITVLDFFAGSGTTGHAVAQLNKEDGGNRTYILCTNNENNICEEVTYQRLKEIQTELPHNLKYFKTDFVPAYSEEESLLSLTLARTRELIELENHSPIDDVNIGIIEFEEDFEEVMKKLSPRAKLYIAQDILLSNNEKFLIQEKQIEVVSIPSHYYRKELIATGEM